MRRASFRSVLAAHDPLIPVGAHDGLSARPIDRAGEEQVLLERKAGPDDVAHGDHLGRQLRLVVGEAAAERLPVLDPGAAQPPPRAPG